MSDDKRQWFERLLSLLPAALRPRDDDQRFLEACRRAYENQWEAAALARLIVARDSQTITNKPLMVIRQLERIGQRPEIAPRLELVHEQCEHACMLGWIDQEDTDCTMPCPIHRPAQLAALRQREAVKTARLDTLEPPVDDETRHAYMQQIRQRSVPPPPSSSQVTAAWDAREVLLRQRPIPPPMEVNADAPAPRRRKDLDD